jgi:hypothetical protein
MNVEIGTEAVQFPEKEYINVQCVGKQGPIPAKNFLTLLTHKKQGNLD